MSTGDHSDPPELELSAEPLSPRAGDQDLADTESCAGTPQPDHMASGRQSPPSAEETLTTLCTMLQQRVSPVAHVDQEG